MKINYGSTIKSVETFDVRFPTSLEGNGSDAMHDDPDYSLCYVAIKTSNNVTGYGMTFTLGKGTNIVCTAVETMKYILEKQKLDDIYSNFGVFWRKLTSESQLRWVRTSFAKLDEQFDFKILFSWAQKKVSFILLPRLLLMHSGIFGEDWKANQFGSYSLIWNLK